MDEQEHERRLAMVTGASSGIGRALAHEFAQHGFDLVIAAEDAGIEGAAVELRTASGVEVLAVRADLATGEGVQALYDAAAATGRPLDAVAINAGVGVGGGAFVDTPLESHLSMIQLNVTGAVQLAWLVLRDMAARGEGGVLFTSSIAATMPGPYYSTYAASKAFLFSFAEAIRHELKDSGVRITALMPGPTDTEFFERAGMTETPAGHASKDDPAEVAKDGFEALMKGADHVVAGSFKNRVQAGSAKVMPATVAAAAHAAQTKPEAASET